VVPDRTDLTMARPVLMAVDDDPAALGVLREELGKRYGADYRVICDADAEAGLRGLEEIQAEGGQVALVLADQWMPTMTGVAFLTRAHGLHPTAQRALLIDWGDRSTAEPILQAATFGQIDDWIDKPTQPGDERFHQAISGFLYDWARLHGPRFQRSGSSATNGRPAPMSCGTCWAATASRSASTRWTPRRASGCSAQPAPAASGCRW
jgi:thioredoxin reductase (NADPH)